MLYAHLCIRYGYNHHIVHISNNNKIIINLLRWLIDSCVRKIKLCHMIELSIKIYKWKLVLCVQHFIKTDCNLQNIYIVHVSMFFNEMPGLTLHHVIVDKENNISFFGFISIEMDIRRTTLPCKMLFLRLICWNRFFFIKASII